MRPPTFTSDDRSTTHGKRIILDVGAMVRLLPQMDELFQQQRPPSLRDGTSSQLPFITP